MKKILLVALTAIVVSACNKPSLFSKSSETETILTEVKLSVNGLCHPKGSQYYDYIKHFTPYNSLNQCVLDGGRLPVKVSE